MVENAEEAFLEGKVEIKSNKKKRKETASKEANDCNAVVPNTMEDGSKLRKGGKRKKNKDLEVSNDDDMGKKDDVAVPNTMEDGSKLSKEGKKKKNKDLEVSHDDDIGKKDDAAVPNTMKDNSKLRKEGKRKKNKDIEVSNDNDVGKKDDDGVIYCQKEISKRKKRRKLEHLEDSHQSNNEIQSVEEERLCLQTDNVIDDSEVKTKKKNKKRLKEDKDPSLSSPEDKYEIVQFVEEVQTDDVNDDSGVKTKKKEKKKKRLKEDKGHSPSSPEDKYEIVHEQRSSGENNAVKSSNKENREVCDSKRKKKTAAAKEVGEVPDENNTDAAEKVERRKRKRENKKAKDVSSSGSADFGNEKQGVETEKGKKSKSAATNSSDQKSKRKSKKVRFASEVEVFSDGLLRGVRFTPEEDVIVKEAVMNYIQVHGLGEQGLDMVLHCKSHPNLKNCWKEIAAALPARTYSSVYYRAHILFERDEKRSWTPEELEFIKKYHAQHGPKWKEMAALLGKHRVHVKDAWRRIKLEKRNKGRWSQEEYQTLYDLVNKDLKMKIYEEKKSKHGMLRDNIAWSAISDTLETRGVSPCCTKWTNQLTSPMVKQNIWNHVDDYRMLQALDKLDACCIEDVDWDNLLENRSGDLCLKRWNEMYNHIGEHGCKSFADQVEVLLKRYCPDVLEAREIWDNKPVVP